MKVISWFIFVLAVAGCATKSPQTDKLALENLEVTSAHRISAVKFIDQGDSYCGPATLAMAMNWNGYSISKQELETQTYTPKMRGSLPENILGATRRHGFLAISVKSISQLIDEVSSNQPVIVFQNVGLSWWPVWHYGLVVGFDLSKKEITLHTGHEAFHTMSMPDFERTWKLADFWGLVVVAPGTLSATGTELQHIAATVSLEQNKKFEDAEKSYRKILERWPNSLVAIIGLANFAYQKGNKIEALFWLQKAVKIHPHSQTAKNNLAFVQKN